MIQLYDERKFYYKTEKQLCFFKKNPYLSIFGKKTTEIQKNFL